MKSIFRWLVTLTLTLGFLLSWSQIACAEPTLNEIKGSELLKTYQPNQKYTLRLYYKDAPEGDDVKKSNAKFWDESSAGKVPTNATLVPSDTAQGGYIEWEIKNFAEGSHKAYFEVENEAGAKVRYPSEPGEFYTFGVVSMTTKWITLGVGGLVSIAAVPFLIYFIARSVNPRGDPSRAARMGLLFGILAACALFIYLFLDIYGILVWAILIVGILAAIVLLLRR